MLSSNSPGGVRVPSSRESTNASDEDTEESNNETVLEPMRGSLQKWTNYIHGWQRRFFLLDDGTLSYYKSEGDTKIGCRGAIAVAKGLVQRSPSSSRSTPNSPRQKGQQSVLKGRPSSMKRRIQSLLSEKKSKSAKGSPAAQRPMIVRINDNDEQRFDVSVNDSIWYLRAESKQERNKWLHALHAFKAESGYGSQGELRRHGSTVSLTSSRSVTSISSFKKQRGLREKIAELETFRDILCRQVDSLQVHFDNSSQTPVQKQTLSTVGTGTGPSAQHNRSHSSGASLINTSAGDPFLALSVPPSNKAAVLGASSSRHSDTDSSQHSSAQHSPLPSGTGSTAHVDTADYRGQALTFKATTAGIVASLTHCLDLMQQTDDNWKRKLEKETERRRRAEEQVKHLQTQVDQMKRLRDRDGPDFVEGPNSSLNDEEWHDALDAALERQDLEETRMERLLSNTDNQQSTPGPTTIALNIKHPLYAEIDRVTREQLHYARTGVEGGHWHLFAEDGSMKMYKREMEIDGIMSDPLKATHHVQGVTAFEYLHYFYEADYKLDWDTTLESMRVVEQASTDTVVIHQLHKRIWPSAQRESLFWSHMRRVDDSKDADAHDMLIVCNKDTDRPDCPPMKTGNVRVGMTVAMVCQTVVLKAAKHKPANQLTRKDISCRIVYVAQVNPGGWVPASAARAIYKREYPKFLKLITQYILHKTQNTRALRF